MTAEKLGISHSKVSYWLRKRGVARRTKSEAGHLAYAKRFKKFSCNIKKRLTPNEEKLLITGIMLYWAEGSKRNNQYVAFSNSDPKMIQLFLKFLREICGVYESRLRVLLHLYDDQEEEKLEKWWSQVTQIPTSQFLSSYTHKGRKGTYNRKSRYGTASLRYYDKKLYKQIIDYIDRYHKKILSPPSSTVEQRSCKA